MGREGTESNANGREEGKWRREEEVRKGNITQAHTKGSVN